ncbi:ACP S-malonyltransferase [Paenibacillus tritici]|uniref:ACP S-malonyltransferase n=1 Tax=Paenibacillus tritici TaxID=1873425 RepID=UPI0024848F33|nr:ACP S-malonyltransferase [Paenibacillus tritici]
MHEGRFPYTNSLCFAFPGVGSQYSGMSKELYEQYSIVRETFEEASDTLHMDMRQLCFDSEEEEKLHKLEYSKPALVCSGIACYRVFAEETGLQPAATMGYSLGEYTALCCAGVISFKDTLEIVHKRALIINEATSGTEGTMAWVINLDCRKVEEICSEALSEGIVIYVSAVDAPAKTSISGTMASIQKVASRLEDSGGMVIPIPMSGPFHSLFMKEAADLLRGILDQYSFSKPRWEVVANWNALPYPDEIGSIKDNLSLQLIHPVRWRNSIEYLLTAGIDSVVELGPKTVLTYLTAINTDRLKSYSVDKPADVVTVRQALLLEQNDYLRVLKHSLAAVAATKNHNADMTNYVSAVSEPYQQIKGLYHDCNHQQRELTTPQIHDVLRTVNSILTAKGLPEDERIRRMRKVLCYKSLVY